MANNTEQRDTHYVDDRSAIRRYPVESVRVARQTALSAATSEASAHAAPLYEPPEPAAIQNQWDNLQPDGSPAVVDPLPQPETMPYQPPAPAPVQTAASVVSDTQAPPNLASSGFGITAIAGAAFGAAAMRRRRRS